MLLSCRVAPSTATGIPSLLTTAMSVDPWLPAGGVSRPRTFLACFLTTLTSLWLGGVIIGSYPRIFFIDTFAGLSFANSLTNLATYFSTSEAFSSGMNRLSTRISHVSGMMLSFRPTLIMFTYWPLRDFFVRGKRGSNRPRKLCTSLDQRLQRIDRTSVRPFHIRRAPPVDLVIPDSRLERVVGPS